MPLELVDFKVFKYANPTPNYASLPTYPEIDLPEVPPGQFWRFDHIAVAQFWPTGTAPTPGAPPAYLFDQPGAMPRNTLGPTQAPLAFSNALQPIPTNGGELFVDVDDMNAAITLTAGQSLAVVFPIYNDPSVVNIVRAQCSIYQGTPRNPTPIAGAGPVPPLPPAR